MNTVTRPILNFSTQGIHSGPWVVLSHALGCDTSMYDEVAANLARDHHVLCYDHRGHGKSQASGPFSIEDLADDAAALITKKCAGQPVVFAGVSLGGMTAQALAARHPQLLRGIVVANSAQVYDDAAKATWPARIHAVQTQGMAAVLDGAIERWFSAEFRAQHPHTIAKARAVLAACNAQNYALTCAAVMQVNTQASNPQIRCKALVVDGAQDQATPPAMSDAIAQTIPGAQRASLQTGHLGATEDAAGFANLVRQFTLTLP